MPRRLSVDIVIPVYNEEAAIATCVDRLRSFLEQEFAHDWKIIIANNGSTDRTLEVARTLSAADSRVEVLNLVRKGRGLALRTASGMSAADIVSYMDVEEITMSLKTRAFVCFLGVLVFAALPFPGLCQGPAKESAAMKSIQQEVPKITVKGKVAYQQRVGSYVVQEETPPYSYYFILNENKKFLDQLQKKNQAVTIEGTLPRGAEFIQIDQIDGQPYTAPK